MSNNFFMKVKEARKNKGFTIKQVHMETGVSVGHLSEYENGKTNIEAEKLISICRYLGISFVADSSDRSTNNTDDKKWLDLAECWNQLCEDQRSEVLGFARGFVAALKKESEGREVKVINFPEKKSALK